jgi:hypothetical protein
VEVAVDGSLDGDDDGRVVRAHGDGAARAFWVRKGP